MQSVYFLMLFVYFGLCMVFTAAGAGFGAQASLFSQSAGLGVRASVAGAPGLQSADPAAAVHTLRCSVAGRSLPNQDQTRVSCLDWWILDH